MKANEAPEEIYILPDGRNPNGLSICWYEAPYCTDAIEYTRTDAFIEKAQLFLIDKLKELPIGDGKMKIKADCSLEGFIEDFKNYMKGE